MIAAEVHGGCMGLPQESNVRFDSTLDPSDTLYHGGQLEDTHPRGEGAIRTRGPPRTRTPPLVFRGRTRSPQVRQTFGHPHRRRRSPRHSRTSSSVLPITRQDSYPHNPPVQVPSMLQRLQHVLRPVLPHLDDTRVPLPHRSPPLHAMAVRFTISQP